MVLVATAIGLGIVAVRFLTRPDGGEDDEQMKKTTVGTAAVTKIKLR